MAMDNGSDSDGACEMDEENTTITSKEAPQMNDNTTSGASNEPDIVVANVPIPVEKDSVDLILPSRSPLTYTEEDAVSAKAATIPIINGSGDEPQEISDDDDEERVLLDDDTIELVDNEDDDDEDCVVLVSSGEEEEGSDGDIEITGVTNMQGEEQWRNVHEPIRFLNSLMAYNRDPATVLADVFHVHPSRIPSTTMAQWSLLFQIISEPQPRKKLDSINTIDHVLHLLDNSSKVMVLSGAGISVSCGIPDFRSRDGIYARLAIDFPDLINPQAMFDLNYFQTNPQPFFKFAKEIYPGQFEPSIGHRFIKALETRGKLLRNYTQNIDTLEQVTGITKVIQCHGSFATASCMTCKHQVSSEIIRDDIMRQVVPRCSRCPADTPMGIMKPDIVFFGEALPSTFHSTIAQDKDAVDLLIVIGSSLKVRPVAHIPNTIPGRVPQILVNRELLSSHCFDVELLGDGDVILDELARRLGYTEVYKSPGSEEEATRPDTDAEATTTVDSSGYNEGGDKVTVDDEEMEANSPGEEEKKNTTESCEICTVTTEKDKVDKSATKDKEKHQEREVAMEITPAPMHVLSEKEGETPGDTITKEKDDAVAKEKDDAIAEGKDDIVAKEKDDAIAKEKDDAVAQESDDTIAKEKDDVVAKEKDNVIAEEKNDVVAQEKDDVVSLSAEKDVSKAPLPVAQEQNDQPSTSTHQMSESVPSINRGGGRLSEINCTQLMQEIIEAENSESRNISRYLPAGKYGFLPPNTYIFPGAEYSLNASPGSSHCGSTSSEVATTLSDDDNDDRDEIDDSPSGGANNDTTDDVMVVGEAAQCPIVCTTSDEEDEDIIQDNSRTFSGVARHNKSAGSNKRRWSQNSDNLVLEVSSGTEDDLLRTSSPSKRIKVTASSTTVNDPGVIVEESSASSASLATVSCNSVDGGVTKVTTTVVRETTSLVASSGEVTQRVAKEVTTTTTMSVSREAISATSNHIDISDA